MHRSSIIKSGCVVVLAALLAGCSGRDADSAERLAEINAAALRAEKAADRAEAAAKKIEQAGQPMVVDADPDATEDATDADEAAIEAQNAPQSTEPDVRT